MIVGIVEGQSLKLDTPVLVSDSVNFLTAVFHFSPDWESLPEKWVHFASGGEGCSLQLQEGRITAEMGLNLPAGSWEVYLHGLEEDDGGNVLRRATTETVRLYVQDFAGFAGEGFPDAPPGIVGQLEQQLEAVRALAEGHAARHGQGGADALSPEDIGAGRVNPNLLDNWYFVNPVNQRGQTEYTGAGYTIDRWRVIGNGTLTVDGDGVTYTAIANGNLRQLIEGNSLAGKTITFSALLTSVTGSITLFVRNDGTAIKTAVTSTDGVVSAVVTLPDALTNLSFEINAPAGTGFKAIAAKLELGTQQTLAHQDADGNWVLNEIPGYGEQLLRCQRYQVKFSSNLEGLNNNTWLGIGFAVSADAARILIELPEELRAAPTATFENLYAVAPTTSFTQREVTAVRNLWPPVGNKTTIQVTLSESVLTVGEPVLLNAYATSYLLLDANL